MEEAVSVFGVVSLWVDVETSMFFQVELGILMLMCTFMLLQQVMISCYRNYNASPHGARIVEDDFQLKKKLAYKMVSSIIGFESHRACLGCFKKMCRCSQSFLQGFLPRLHMLCTIMACISRQT